METIRESPGHLAPEHCALLVVDIQEKLMPVIHGRQDVIDRSVLLIKACREIGLPILATTQYVARIGPLMSEVTAALEGVRPVDKLEFDCFANTQVNEAFQKIPRQVNTVIVCGVETHICIYQSMLGGLMSGYRMWVAADAVSSRAAENKHIGLERIRQIGGNVGSVEMIIYDLLGKAGTSTFKAILPLVK